MNKIGQQPQKQTQLITEGYNNKKEGDGSQKEKMNKQAQTHPTKKIADTVQQIAQAMMVELQYTTYGYRRAP